MRTIDTAEDWILNFSEMLHSYVNNMPNRITGNLYDFNDLVDFIENVVERKQEEMTRTMINTQSPFFHKGFNFGVSMTKQQIQKFYQTRLGKEGGSSFECSDYEGICEDMKLFIDSLLAEQKKLILKKGDELIKDSKSSEFQGSDDDRISYEQALTDYQDRIKKI